MYLYLFKKIDDWEQLKNEEENSPCSTNVRQIKHLVFPNKWSKNIPC